MGPTADGAKSVELWNDWLPALVVVASPLQVSNRQAVLRQEGGALERGRLCVDSQRFPIHFTSLPVT